VFHQARPALVADRAGGLAGLSLAALGRLRAAAATLAWLVPVRVLSGGRMGEIRDRSNH